MTSINSARGQVVDAVESYVRGLGGCDLSKARLHPDVVYESPISPPREGVDAVVEFLSGLFPIITGVVILDHIVEGDLCATRFDLHTVAGSAHVFDRFEVREGHVARINPYYDPAPLLAAMATGGHEQPGVTPGAVAGIHHLALTVSDADRSAAWYRALLGLHEVARIDDASVSARILANDALLIAVRQYHNGQPDGFDEMRVGLDHLAFEVSTRQELDAWEQRLRDRDIPVSPVAETTMGSVVVFRDPDNIQLEFWLPAP